MMWEVGVGRGGENWKRRRKKGGGTVGNIMGESGDGEREGSCHLTFSICRYEDLCHFPFSTTREGRSQL